MFKNLRTTETEKLNHSGRSLVGETLQLEGDLRSSGNVDVAGLVNGNVFVSEIRIIETGSIRGTLEAETVEINGHVEGKISALREALPTENPEDIRTASDNLMQVMTKIGEAVYAQKESESEQASPEDSDSEGTESQGESPEDTVEGDYREA